MEKTEIQKFYDNLSKYYDEYLNNLLDTKRGTKKERQIASSRADAVKSRILSFLESNGAIYHLIDEKFWNNNPYALDETYGRYFERDIHDILDILKQELKQTPETSNN